MADDGTKSLIRSCLISAKEGLTLSGLQNDYSTLVGGVIPYRAGGFSSLEEYLRAMPDVVRFQNTGGSLLLHCVVNASTANIASMVARQKSNKKKPIRRPRGVAPRGGVYGGPGFHAPRFDYRHQRVRNVRPAAAAAPWGAPRFGQQFRAPASARMPLVRAPFRPAAAPPLLPSPQPARSASWSQMPPRRLPPRPSAPCQQPVTVQPPAPVSRPPSAAPPSQVSPPVAAAPPRQPPARPPSAGSSILDEFEAVRLEMRLPEPKVSTVPSKGGTFFAKLTIGDITCLTYPNESPNARLATELAYRMALDLLKEQRQQNNSRKQSPITEDTQLLVSRIDQILSSRPNGLWMSSVPNQYRQTFAQALPGDWESVLYDAGSVRFDRVGTDRYILYRTSSCADGDTQPSIATTSLSTLEPAVLPSGPVIKSVDLPDENCFPVYVTSVLGGSQIAFRVLGDEYNELLDTLLTEMEITMVDGLVPVTPAVGGFYLARIGDQPHRVQVTDILDDMVDIFYVDYGDTELLPASVLSALEPRFAQLPGQAIHAAMWGIDPDLPGCHSALSKCLLNRGLMCQVEKADESRLEVTLFDTSGDDDINLNELLQRQLATVPAPSLPKASGFADAFIVYVEQEQGAIYIQLDQPAVDELLQRVTAAGQMAAQSQQLAVGLRAEQLVLARFMDDWFRARLLAAPQHGQVHVQYLDYGNEDIVLLDDIRPLPDSLNYPAQCLQVRLSGIPPPGYRFSSAAAGRLMQLVPSDDTRVFLRVVSNIAGSIPEVEAFKRMADNSIMAINTTLAFETSLFEQCNDMQGGLVSASDAGLGRQSTLSNGTSSSSRSAPVRQQLSFTDSASSGGSRRQSLVDVVTSPAVRQRSLDDSAGTNGARSRTGMILHQPMPTEDRCRDTRQNGHSAAVFPPPATAVVSRQLSDDSRASVTFAGYVNDGGGDTLVASPLRLPTGPPSIPSVDRLEVAMAGVQLEQHHIVTEDHDGYLDVMVAYCSSPWNIYVQPHSEGERLKTLMTAMQDFYNTASNWQSITPKQVVAGRSYAVRHHDNLWYRARVLTLLDSAQATVKFVDYGDFSHVSLEEQRVQPLLASFAVLSAQAIKARLGGIRPINSVWDVQDCLHLNGLLANQVLVAELHVVGTDQITNEQQLTVRLVDTSGPEDIYIDQLMVEARHAAHTGDFSL